MTPDNDILLINDDTRTEKDTRSRLMQYVAWLDAEKRAWHDPDLDAHRDYLLEEQKLAPRSVAAHISTIRGRYYALQESLPDIVTQLNDPTIGTVGEIAERIGKDALQAMGNVDFEASLHYRALSSTDIESLMAQQTTKTHQGVRNILIFGLMLCAGLRESEVIEVGVEDIDHQAWQVRVPDVQGRAPRTVPIRDDLFFGDRWLKPFIEYHVQRLHLPSTSPLVQSYWRGGNKIRSKSLSLRGMQKMLAETIVNEGESAWRPTAMAYRRTYARHLYRNRVGENDLKNYLGIEQGETLRRYIGPPDRYPMPLDIPHDRLPKLPEQRRW